MDSSGIDAPMLASPVSSRAVSSMPEIARQQPAQHVGEEQREPRVDAGQVRGLHVAADGVEVAPQRVRLTSTHISAMSDDRHDRPGAGIRDSRRSRTLAELPRHAVDRHAAGQVQRDAETDRSDAERHHERRDVEHRHADAVGDADSVPAATPASSRPRSPATRCRARPRRPPPWPWRPPPSQRHDRADRQIEPAGQQRQHLAQRDDGQIDRLPHDVHQVLPVRKWSDSSVNTMMRDQQQERQHAEPDEQLLETQRQAATARLRLLRSGVAVLAGHAASRSKKWLSTFCSVMSLPRTRPAARHGT